MPADHGGHFLFIGTDWKRYAPKKGFSISKGYDLL